MATLEVGAGWGYGLDMDALDISNYQTLTLISASSTYITADYSPYDPGYTVEFLGTGFTFDYYGDWIGGTLTGIAEHQDGSLVSTTSGLSIAASQFVYWIENSETQTALKTMFAGDDLIYGSIFDDRLYGFAGNDLLSGGEEGDDTLDGGAGIDTVDASGFRSQYTLSKTSGGFQLQDNVSGRDGTDALVNIERLQFADRNIALDLASTDNAGQALLFIGVLAHDLIASPEIVGMILGYFDGGMNMQQLNQLAVDVGLVSSLAGGSSNADVARLAYQNVIGAAATTDVVDFLVSFMDGRNASFSQSEFLTAVANLDVNQAHVDLVGLAQTGVEYLMG